MCNCADGISRFESTDRTGSSFDCFFYKLARCCTHSNNYGYRSILHHARYYVLVAVVTVVVVVVVVDGCNSNSNL